MAALKTQFQLHGFKFDKRGFTRAAEKGARKAVYQSAQEWLREIIKHVPIWSGQALGSVKYAKGRSGDSSGLFLGEYLKVAIPINAAHATDKKNAHTGGTQGRFAFSFNDNRHEYRFSHQTDVIYYVIQDFYNIGISPTAPWLSVLFARHAFLRHLDEIMPQHLPKVDTYLIDSLEYEAE